MGVSEGGQARTRQRKPQHLGFRPFSVTLCEALWVPQAESGWFIQIKRTGILVSAEGVSEGGL